MSLKFVFCIGVLLVGCVFYSGEQVVLAATGESVIHAFIGDDTNPPTVPVLQSVTPVASTQITVVWQASTDDVFLIGYRLFRNGTQIATTTLTSFGDGGLLPGTLYEYTVDAFDSFGNISSTSLPLATTTLSDPVPPATTTPTTTTAVTSTQVTRLDSIQVIPDLRSALIRFQTNTNARYTVMWGRTTSYELGSISTNLFKQSHETKLDNLEPGTHYWYSILATSANGVTQKLSSGEFMTLPVFQSASPENVRNIASVVNNHDVTLSWVNPLLPEGSVVRVMRSHLFYPTSPTDGALVYEGVGSEVMDSGALTVRSPQYYTVFVVDKDGVVSSGAVTVVYLPGVLPPSVQPLSTSTISEPVVEESGDAVVLRASAILVRQGVVTRSLSDSIQLFSNQGYSIIIPVEAVAAHLKSIIVSIQDPTDQRLVTTYLLKLNKAGDAYEAVVQSPNVVGTSRITVEVFDFNQASIRRIATTLTFVTERTPLRVFPDDVVWYGKSLLLPVSIFFGVLSFWWLIVLIRRRRREDNR